MEQILFTNDVGHSFSKEIRIATLGPSGTSSEATANWFGSNLVALERAERWSVGTFASYEEAAAMVLNSNYHALIVANAYSGVNEFYMDRRLSLLTAFIRDTPNYGLVSKRRELSGPVRIATHPAPFALVAQMLPACASLQEVIYTKSTSEAAKAVALGTADAALTTEPAAWLHGLNFVSPLRTITMLWSVFSLRETPLALTSTSTSVAAA